MHIYGGIDFARLLKAVGLAVKSGEISLFCGFGLIIVCLCMCLLAWIYVAYPSSFLSGNSYRDILYCNKKPFYLKGLEEDSSIMDSYIMHSVRACLYHSPYGTSFRIFVCSGE